jgi:hypothetical protein
MLSPWPPRLFKVIIIDSLQSYKSALRLGEGLNVGHLRTRGPGRKPGARRCNAFNAVSPPRASGTLVSRFPSVEVQPPHRFELPERRRQARQ